MKVLLAHPGTQHSFQLARQLYKRGMLYEFHSGFAFGKDSWVYKLFSKLPSKIYNKISNRFIDEVPDRYIRRYLFLEINAMLKIRLPGQDEETVFFRRNERFQKSISEASITAADAVIGFDTSSWILAEKCKKMGKIFFLDVCTPHPVANDTVYLNLIKRFPEWKLPNRQKPQTHIAVELAEMELAGHIVVASNFALGTYVKQGVGRQKISINSYGVDSQQFKPLKKKQMQEDIIRFVFVGLVNARKGVPFLLETWKKISAKNIELTLIGSISAANENYIRTHFPSVIIKGKLAKKELKEQLPNYDIFVFPSFFDGFGLVIPEAMASGLPVITTSATCGPDLIENGNQGFVIEPGNEEQLRSAIEFFINQEDKLQSMGQQARLKVEDLTWDAYGDQWNLLLNKYKQ
ncbi:MAG: glycosyltransferase family 4 protein [Ferruginibacter sp.]